MTYLGEGGRIPYLDEEEIIGKAEAFLREYWNGDLPVDIEAVCDNLGVSVIPVSGLNKEFYVDAYTSSDFSTIYVDEKEFNKESYRYRFSVAHELGHIILHRKYYPKRINNVDEWCEASKNRTTKYAEYQANCFAANLLVPRKDFTETMNRHFNGDFLKNVWTASASEQYGIYASVQRRYRVSNDVIARRLKSVFPDLELDDD